MTHPQPRYLPLPAPHSARAGFGADLRPAGATVLAGVPAGAAWRGLFALRSPEEWGVEGFFAVDGLLLAVALLLGFVVGAVYLWRPGASPLRRYLLLVPAVLAAELLAWGVGRLMGMPTLTVPGVIVGGPLALGLVGIAGSAWRASRS